MSKTSSAHQTVTAYAWCHSKAVVSRVQGTPTTWDTEEKKRNRSGEGRVLVKFLISSLPTDRVEPISENLWFNLGAKTVDTVQINSSKRCSRSQLILNLVYNGYWEYLWGGCVLGMAELRQDLKRVMVLWRWCTVTTCLQQELFTLLSPGL
jgi:hypothetical protein